MAFTATAVVPRRIRYIWDTRPPQEAKICSRPRGMLTFSVALRTRRSKEKMSDTFSLMGAL